MNPTPREPHVPPTTGFCNVQSLVLLCILPFTHIGAFLWCYTALPLHFLDSNWPIWQLSLLFFLIYVPRVFVQLLTRLTADWICVPISAIAVVSNIILFLYPNSLVAVSFALSATCSSLNPTAIRGLIHDRFHSSGNWQMKRALRIYTFSDTLGYATAPFIGGLLYDNGGLKACALYALVLTSIGMIFPMCLYSCRKSFLRSWKHCGCTTKDTNKDVVSTANPKQIQIMVVENITKDDNNKSIPTIPTTIPTTTNDNNKSSSATREKDVVLPHAAVFVVMLTVFTNICTYAVEWCLYALYFRLEYGWSGAWCGFAQMVGDLLGAGVLTISTMKCAQRACGTHNKDGDNVDDDGGGGGGGGGDSDSDSGCCCCFSRCKCCLMFLLMPPFNIAFFLFCHGILMIMLAQPHFVVAIIGQILMGTVYVFFEQSLQEMILVYSGSSRELYRRLLSIHYLVFTAGCALCSPIAYGMYELSGFSSAFYASGGFAFAIGICVIVFYVCRFSSSSVGIFGSFVEMEKELRVYKQKPVEE